MKEKVLDSFLVIDNSTPKQDSTDRVVSYSQYNIWSTCPHQWKLIYIDGFAPQGDSIETVFGSAMHDTIQEWLPMHFTDEAHARKLDLNPIFKDKLIARFKESVIENGDGTKVAVCDPSTIQEYYEDGCAILDHVQKYAKEFFPTKGYRLIGCEVPLDIPLGPGLRFHAYLDIVVHDVKLNQFYITDLKTSRMGWYENQKRDPKKINQILLYKEYFSKKYNVPMESIFPRFVILKRKIKEHPDFIVRRISKFEPSHGRISMNKVREAWNSFLTECFDEMGKYKPGKTKPTPSERNCKYCPFAANEDRCPDSFYLKRAQQQKRNRSLI